MLPPSKHHYYYYFHHPHHNFASAIMSPLCSSPISPLPLPYFCISLRNNGGVLPNATIHQWHPTVPPLLCALLLFRLHHLCLKREGWSWAITRLPCIRKADILLAFASIYNMPQPWDTQPPQVGAEPEILIWGVKL